MINHVYHLNKSKIHHDSPSLLLQTTPSPPFPRCGPRRVAPLSACARSSAPAWRQWGTAATRRSYGGSSAAMAWGWSWRPDGLEDEKGLGMWLYHIKNIYIHILYGHTYIHMLYIYIYVYIQLYTYVIYIVMYIYNYIYNTYVYI
jgi:hypothetical protein